MPLHVAVRCALLRPLQNGENKVPVYDIKNNRVRLQDRRAASAAALRVVLAGATVATVALLSACATRPPASDFHREVTHALPTSTPTELGTALAPLERAHPDESGFRVLSNGTEALQMRIALARAATKTLDMQYYIANEDTTGKL